MQTVEFRVGNADDVVHVAMSDVDADDGVQRAGFAGDALRRATITFEQAVDTVRPVAEALVSRLAGMDSRPSEIEVTFGLTLNGSASAKIVSGGAESHMNVTLRWGQGSFTGQS